MLFLLLFLLIIFLYCFWKYFLRSKLIKLNKINRFDFNKILKVEVNKKQEPIEKIKDIVSEEDIRLFDNVAKLMFEKAIKNTELKSANKIQYEFLNKMPTQASSQIIKFDLQEWSIYWTYKTQSLEYYASRYGIFYTHVDRNGIEHKLELKC